MEDPIVKTQSGDIRGLVVNHEDGFDFYAFKGIPYAEPPVGELRFKDPVPKKPWTEVLDCKNYREKCVQHDIFFKAHSYNEDCLHLNVFTHSINDKIVRNPVIFVIHGGAFAFGSSGDLIFGPEYLIRKNIVLVTVNYRLGILGFLNFEDAIVPGNQGLKDQLLALKWVRQNIRQFGGNPDNVTLLGISAGAVCAHFLALSELSKGLVHKLIAQSGAIMNPIGCFKNPKSIAIKLCSILGKELTNPAEMLQFLQSLDTKKLQEGYEPLRKSMTCLPLGPTVDDKSSNPVMPIDPVFAANQGTHIPVIVGCNARETNITLLAEISFPGLTRTQFFEKCDANFEQLMQYNAHQILQRYDLTLNQVRRLYYKSEKICDENVDKYVNLSTDLHFVEGVHRFCRVQAERSSSSTYLYLFSYDPPDSLCKGIMENCPNGASHLDELPYFFKMRALEKLGLGYAKKGTRQYRMMEQVTELWTNFATYGRPTVKTTDLIPVHWTPLRDGTVLRYLDIDEDMTMQSTINVDQKFLSARGIKA